jgi:RNA polymerase sigma factor (TIGR02999 family)
VLDESAVTTLLDAHRAGDAEALGRLLPHVYDELRRQARAQNRRWAGVETLNTTALVHEAYLKLAGSSLDASGRAHLLAVAGRAMRQVLIDYVKRQKAGKRGGGAERADVEADQIPDADAPAVSVLELTDVLDQLEAASPDAARIVECRFFAGMSVEETAEALGVSVPTVVRRWRVARAFLHHHLRGDAGETLLGGD